MTSLRAGNRVTSGHAPQTDCLCIARPFYAASGRLITAPAAEPATGKPDEAKKQLELIDVVDRLAQATGEKTNRNLAVIYADQPRKLDRSLELVREELKVRQDIYTYDALGWVLTRRGSTVRRGRPAIAR